MYVEGPRLLPSHHRQLEPLLLRTRNGFRVAGVGVAHDAGAGIVGEDALEAAVGFRRAVADDHHPGMLGKADPDAAAVMDRNPGRA